MERFWNDLKKYGQYVVYAGKADLKSEIANSHLSWLWWLLDPLLFMLVYTFIALVVFGKGEKYFPLFVFIGLTAWKFFDRTIKQSVTIVSANRQIVSKTYIPKYILILVKMYANGFKLAVSYILVAIMLFIYRVPLSWNILYFFPFLLLLMMFTFGASCIMLHFGVFVEDLSNVMNVLLRLTFYMTGIFFSVKKRVPEPFNQILLKCNPMAFILDGMRECVLYENAPSVALLVIWLLISALLIVAGVRIIYRYENSYVKVI